ncbi:SulP family inorganic anion transporter [Alsobacter sp. SYSU M60028]|uniref:SulP family inorganic anion transporter n=1 Tax=Alsobacter ponti TaxID=2962936 RepID=A0ABT1LDI4_9HYPH|nr:SulP family inorganic anion transporter [Alsobacter ponti]MCP8939489.1 SulP family inorganic anion transporter [Alsobacter ponti]
MTESLPRRRTEPTFAELFTPKLVTVLREGYGAAALRADAIAGVTVAMVALPLSMAIAKASGMSPDRGLFTAIVGGIIISALGGSRFQIGGPAGAFIVLVASVIERHGLDGFALATLIMGAVLMAVGFLRLGTYIKYIPHPVTVGFTSGIAVIIFASQLSDLFGLRLAGREPAAFIPKLEALWAARDTVAPGALLVTAASLAVILVLRKLRPHWPGFLVAIFVAALLSLALSRAGLPVETIGTRYGGIPSTLPMPTLPTFSLEKFGAVLPDALAMALLGGIESLLSAVVADGMTGRRHRSNCELVAQGVANIGSALVGGVCATGTIARTATNVRAGARGPVAGILHSLVLLLLMLVAAPLAAYIPLAALAAVLAVVSWNMAEKAEFAAILRRSRGDSAVLLATFLLTVFRDLTEGIAVGVVLGAMVFMHRMAELVEVQTHQRLFDEDQADSVDSRGDYKGVAGDERVVYRISGPFFFGAAHEVSAVLERIGQMPKDFVIDMSGVPFVDSTGAESLASFVRKAARSGTAVTIAGAPAGVRRVLFEHGLKPPLVAYAVDAARPAEAVA